MGSYANNVNNQIEQTADALGHLQSENIRLMSILRDVRMYCTFDPEPGKLHKKLWPLVIDFDEPCDYGDELRAKAKAERNPR